MKIIIIIFLSLLSLQASCQDDKTFTSPATFEAGFRFSKTGTIYTNMPSGGSTDWLSITNKPNFFDGKYSSLLGTPSLFPPTAHRHDYSQIDNRPSELDLSDAVSQLSYLPIPQKTTTEINAIIVPAGVVGIVYDKTLKVYKVWTETVWKIAITGN
jgi:hypothetical protein